MLRWELSQPQDQDRSNFKNSNSACDHVTCYILHTLGIFDKQASGHFYERQKPQKIMILVDDKQVEALEARRVAEEQLNVRCSISRIKVA